MQKSSFVQIFPACAHSIAVPISYSFHKTEIFIPRYKSRLHWFVPSGLGGWMVSNVGVDRSNVHEMVWWQEEMQPTTGARNVFQSLLSEFFFAFYPQSQLMNFPVYRVVIMMFPSPRSC